MLFSEQDILKIIEEYINGVPLCQISKDFNSYPSKIRTLLKNNGIEIVGNKNRFPRKSNFFECINNNEKAYWLGYLYADGCLTNGYTISITSIDKEHLIKFRSALENNNKISKSIDKRFITDKILYHYQIRDKKNI